MSKYNLKWYQWLEVVPLWFIWLAADKNKRKKSFHLVLKGMEDHEHNFTIPIDYGYYQCNYGGCNAVEDLVQHLSRKDNQ